MSPELAHAARTLVAADSPAEVAANAVRACDQLAQHLAPLVGELGTRTLLARSVTLTSARVPWIANTIARTAPADGPWSALKAAMEQQDARAASDAFVDLLSTFAALLGRLIGDDLVEHLLNEVWPEVFPTAAPRT